MNDPSTWAEGAAALADPALSSVDELTPYLDLATRSSGAVGENLRARAQYLRTAKVSERVCDQVDTAAAHAEDMRQHLATAAENAYALYGEIAFPDFSKAG